MIEIDGSWGEAGGQILRTATALSVLLKKPVRVFNIRAKRPKPGLKTQHLMGILALKELSAGRLSGAELGSQEIRFWPGEIRKRQIEIKIPTAGSIGLVLQTLQLACLGSEKPVRIRIQGGADFGKFAPPIPWLQRVLLPLLEKMGYRIEIKSLKSGFYPKGGAETLVRLEPKLPLKPLKLLDQGTPEIHGLSIASLHLKPREVAERQARSAEEILKQIAPCQIETKYVDALCPGSGLVLWLSAPPALLGSSGIGERGVRAEEIGERAAKELMEDFKKGACVDRWATDQLLPFLALAAGKSELAIPELTSHAETNIWVIRKFLPAEFRVEKRDGRLFLLVSPP